MTILNTSLRRPLTVVVLVLAVCLGAWVALQRMTRDVFPPLNVPTIYVAQPFGGMDPAQMEGYLTYYYEYHFLYITGIEHVESKSIQGASLMKLQFHPGTDMSAAMAETVAYVNRARAFMPLGTPGPFIMRFDAGSVAVGQLVFSSENTNRTVAQMQDVALNMVRPLFATLPGVSAPPPFGGGARTILINVKSDRMRAYNFSPDEIVAAISQANLISPSGNMNLGDKYPIVPVNAVVKNIKDLEGVPLRVNANGAVFVRDVATVDDGSDIVTSYALVNGRRTVYMPVTKRADASTLTVVELVKKNLPRFMTAVPATMGDVKITYEFDQSPVVTRSINDLVKEGGIGALLTGLMVLLFLRDWRSAFIVVINIPISLLAATFALWVSGQNINLMTLGGLALAVGILVDEATVAVENIHAHLARGASLARAALDATRETALPRLLAMLCVLAVFIPAFFMVGAAKSLFVPLALAVGFSMVASFILSSTLVPILSVWFLRGAHAPRVQRPAPSPDASGGSVGEAPTDAAGAAALPIHDPGFIGTLQSAYASLLRGVVAARWLLVLVYLVASLGVVWFFGKKLGTEIFPTVDSGQFAVRLRAPSGTKVENTEEVALKALNLIKREAGADNIAITMGLVGVHAANYPINLIHLWNGGPEEAHLSIQLKPHAPVKVSALKEKLRAVFAAELPDVRVSFEPSDIVSRVMSFGSPTPIEVAVSGPALAVNKEHADKIYEQLKKIPALRDVHFAQSLDFPTVDVNVNRERAGLLGVKMGDVTRSLVAATTSSRFTVPNYWADPASGVSYNLQIQIPQAQTKSLDDVKNVPVTSSGGKNILLRNVASVTPGSAVGLYERYNMARVVSITANIHGASLGEVLRDIAAIEEISNNKLWPAKTRVDVRGQATTMNQLLEGFRSGLVIAVIVIFLMLAANFQSLRLAFAVISTVPAVLAGVVLMLWLTHTTLNIQSAMGAIMAVGVAVANAILLVTFAEKARSAGVSPAGGVDVKAAAIEGARSRLRPILMTSCAMIAGMMPLALGLGEGGDQTAPLGRAVVGGLALATVATLFVLPAVFAMLASRKVRSPSLDPEDPASTYFVGEAK
ncbi:MAG: efflux RND transporter permease subunit [Verrucomicrobia bacterium]|nr:efflux RND transporter permease subunit [Verrucomicrobiota bacterium]